MATSREEGGRYDGGLGAGGKFKKRPFRRTSQATPYDRPPTAIRNPGSGNGNGWLSKLMDPAQRLITYSANKLFASVFRKRLSPPPPPKSSEPETYQETRENFQEAASTGPAARQEGGQDGSGGFPAVQSDGGKFAELEAILKQKTFTRAEIDHLTALLRARTADNVGGTVENRSEVRASVLPRDEEFPNTYSRENGTDRPHISTPPAISNFAKAPIKDIASPAELAKAYMGSQPSKVSSPIINLRSQPQKEKFSVPSSSLFPSKSPVMSLVPRSSDHIGGLENGFKAARSRGRSAIYNMARTPYSRANTSASFKSAGPRADALAGPSSSSSPQSAWDQSRLSVSRQVALKRRLDIDVGSVGPIRRIRQKSNLLSPRSLALPASGSPISIRENESGSEAQNSLSLMNKPFSSSEVKDTITKAPTENGISSSPLKSTTPVSSKSSQMASKILNQLNELVSTREKSPTKLSPSMLNGPALKSLENVDSSKLLENSRGKNKLDSSDGASLPGIQSFMSSKQDKLEENSKMKLFAPSDKSVSLVNGVGPSSLLKETVLSTNATGSLSIKSVTPFPQQKKRAFKMSAHEDYLDLDDDDDQPNVAASSSFATEREKLDGSASGSEKIAPEPAIVEKPSTVSEIKPHTSPGVNQKPSSGPYDGYLSAEKEASTTSCEANLLITSTQPAVLSSPPTSFLEKPVSTELSPGSPMFSSGEKKSFPSKEQNGSIFSFGAAADGKVQSVSESSGFKSDGGLDSRPGNSNSFESVAPAANNVAKSDESTKAGNDNASKPGFLFSAPATATATANSSAVSTPSSTGNIFKFGVAANASNGSLASSPFLFSSQPSPVIPNSNASQSSSSTSATGTTATEVTTTNSSSQPSVPLFTSTTDFKSAPPVNPSTSISLPTAIAPRAATEAQTKDTTTPASAPFAGTSTFTSSGNSIFGFTSTVTSNPSSSSAGTTSAVTSFGNSPFGGLTSSATNTSSSSGTSLISNTSSIFGNTSSSTTSTGSGMFSSTPASTAMGGNIFGFSAPAATSLNQSQSGNTFAAGSNSSSAAGSSVATSTQSTLSASSPLFSTAGNSTFASGGSLFGSSSSSQSFGSGATFGFKSSSSETNAVSTSGATTASLFGSSWAAPKTPAFGTASSSSSSSTGFAFGASSTSTAGNTSAPVVFGSSASAPSNSIFPFSSATATTSQPVFGGSTPGFAFGSSAPPASNNDQMEDSMAEDTVQATATPTMPVFGQQPAAPATPTMPVFGQQPATPPSSGYIFGSTPTSGANPFPFGGQPSIATPQTPNPFQASSSVEFNAGGSFSLGSSGVDKSNRKYIRPKGSRQRKK